MCIIKIKFKRKRWIANLIAGLAWITFSIVNLLLEETISWFSYGYVAIGIYYICIYLNELLFSYITINSGTLQKNIFFGINTKMTLKHINRIKKFAGEYTLEAEQKKLKINTEYIETTSLTTLHDILTDLNLHTNKTPFVKNDI